VLDCVKKLLQGIKTRHPYFLDTNGNITRNYQHLKNQIEEIEKYGLFGSYNKKGKFVKQIYQVTHKIQTTHFKDKNTIKTDKGINPTELKQVIPIGKTQPSKKPTITNLQPKK